MRVYKREKASGMKLLELTELTCDCCGRKCDDKWLPHADDIHTLWGDGSTQFSFIAGDWPGDFGAADVCPTCAEWLVERIKGGELKRAWKKGGGR